MRTLVICITLLVVGLQSESADAHQAARYQNMKKALRAQRQSLTARFWRQPRSRRYGSLEAQLLKQADGLHRMWIGSRWGLGMPQSTVPHLGKTNCGLFVAVVLRDLGFNLPIWKFNRQASYHAIRSVAPRRSIRYFSRTPMGRFIKRVKAMGEGLYVIGLDFHIGFLRYHKSRGIRFIHASYVTRRVVDEPADAALPIVTSKRRVVGKILQPRMLRWWVSRRRIHVLGPR